MIFGKIWLSLLWILPALCTGMTNSVEAKGIDTQVTYPTGLIDTFSPAVAFIAAPHEAVEAEIISGGSVVWSSGEVETRDYQVSGARLDYKGAYTARVRVKQHGSWQEWSQPVEFSTPAQPVVRIVNPAHAGRAMGPMVRVEILVDSPGEPETVTARLGKRVIDLTGKPGNPGVFTGEAQAKEGVGELIASVLVDGRRQEAKSRFWTWNSPQTKGELVVLDLTGLAQWKSAENPEEALRMYDLVHAAAVLQGIVNRKGPRMMIRILETDQEWLEFLRERGGWLENVRLVEFREEGNPEKAFLDVVDRFRKDIRGLVVWDRNVYATSNVASTAAGVDDLLPVRSDAFGTVSMGLRKRFRVVVDLVGKFTGSGQIPDTQLESTGSAKNDAYLWAKVQYLDSGRANPLRLGYWLDSFWLTNPGRQPWWEHCLTNHDWVVRNRGFFFDLANFEDDRPQDDPDQTPGTDYRTFREIMLSAHRMGGGKMIHVAGFTPWAFKYTDHAIPPSPYHPVHTEWGLVHLISAFNGYLDADAHGLSGMSNASLWTQAPMPDRFVQSRLPSRLDMQQRGYMDENGVLAPLGFTMFYIGDFDSAAWVSRRILPLWRDPLRGTVPMGWAINPNLSDRIAPAFLFMHREKTAMDFFTAGDSGAGYVNPTMLFEPRKFSGLPAGDKDWIEHNLELYRKFNYRITGFLINGHAGALTEESLQMTAAFSPDGAASQVWLKGDNRLVDGMPMARMHHDLDPDVQASVDCMNRFRTDGTQFLNFRTILLGPEYITRLTNAAMASRPEAPYAMVDPYTFYYLLRHSLGGTNEKRATFTFDNLPPKVRGGRTLKAVVGVRNDGWDVWKAGSTFLTWGLEESVDWTKTQRVALPHDVAPGEGAVLEFDVLLPQATSEYVLYYDMASDGQAFRNRGGQHWEKRFSAF